MRIQNSTSRVINTYLRKNTTREQCRTWDRPNPKAYKTIVLYGLNLLTFWRKNYWLCVVSSPQRCHNHLARLWSTGSPCYCWICILHGSSNQGHEICKRFFNKMQSVLFLQPKLGVANGSHKIWEKLGPALKKAGEFNLVVRWIWWSITFSNFSGADILSLE